MSESKKTVFVVGLGPGGGQFLTVQAQSALQQAEVLCGYTVYIDLVIRTPDASDFPTSTSSGISSLSR